MISGAHLYGFPSKDSDVDFRGCFIADTNYLLSLNKPKDTISSLYPDYQIFELEKEIKLSLKGNFNVLEHIFTKPIYTTPEHKHLLGLVYNALAKKGIYESYKGMVIFNYKKFILGGKQTYKKYLYVFRGLLAGRYFLETSMIQPNLEKLNSAYKFPEIKRLINAKKNRDEKSIVYDINSGKLDELIQYCIEKIDEAYIKCSLTELPDKKAVKDLNSFLIKMRKDLLL
jgi:predicted nucleotidyltransferase